ncbi:hypothetical protein HPB50_003912 [Hyalomma asiaticum]|uniref:Uncharacterized protein n=1 Tax=Hyalomma asiaticum TaxID=266040 RepID=A0ACB7T7V6_HYAAI|nr:hypothetical protein HPB50_003912 [Hyalomma asiaticum]
MQGAHYWCRQPYAGTIGELVLTNCVNSDPRPLCEQIAKCTLLQSLQCVGCALALDELLGLLLNRLSHLVQLEFSLDGTDVSTEIDRLLRMTCAWQGRCARRLRRVYVEIGADRCFELLRTFLSFCPNLKELHVHLVRGSFSDALSECHRIREQLALLETFTFTSELQASVSYPYEPYPPSTFMKYAAICANVRHKKSGDLWSCARLNDLAVPSNPIRVLPSQLTVVVEQDTDAATRDRFRQAGRHNVWTHVRQLCLMLLPEKLSCYVYPKASFRLRDCLREFFTTTLFHIVELNVSSFHFNIDIDLIQLLPEEMLNRLQALSLPPCAFQCRSALRRLTISSFSLRELDVRTDKRGGIILCSFCMLCVTDMVELHPDDPVWPAFRNVLVRLTLHDVQPDYCLWFARWCRAFTVRLSEWLGIYRDKRRFPVALGLALASNGVTRCLLLRHEDLPIADADVLATLSRVTSLRHLYLLTSMKFSDNDAAVSVTAATRLIPQLESLHVHYRRDTDNSEQRVTWVRRQRTSVLLRNHPCFTYCSTATFIGLAKPRNRDYTVQ